MKIWMHFFLSFVKTVLAVLCVILVIYFIITYIENSLYYFKTKTVSPKIMFLYYFWQLPDIALQILPFAVLISGVILHWSLSRTGEIYALKSAGMSLWRISFPLACGALFCVFTHLTVSEFVRPNTFKNFYNIKYNFIEHIPETDLFVKTNWVKSKNGILHFDEYNAVTKTLKNPEFFEFEFSSQDPTESFGDSSKKRLKLIASSSLAMFDAQKNTWVLSQPSLKEFKTYKKYEISYVQNFDTDVHFAPPKVLRENVSSNELGYFELSDLIASAKKAHIKVSNRIVDLYFKLSAPFSNLLFLLFTIPFAMQSERREASYFSILICLGLTTMYWLGNLALKNLASHDILPPIIAAWGLNVVFGAIAVAVISKLDKPA